MYVCEAGSAHTHLEGAVGGRRCGSAHMRSSPKDCVRVLIACGEPDLQGRITYCVDQPRHEPSGKSRARTGPPLSASSAQCQGELQRHARYPPVAALLQHAWAMFTARSYLFYLGCCCKFRPAARRPAARRARSLATPPATRERTVPGGLSIGPLPWLVLSITRARKQRTVTTVHCAQ